MQELGLVNAKPVGTPGEAGRPEDDVDNYDLKPAEHRKFRALAARANHFSMDRPDIQFAVKELCRAMSAPKKRDWDRLRRLGKYLEGAKRAVVEYNWQGPQVWLRGYSDSDWAGCIRTGRSTSGGAVLLCTHWIRSWSTTQKVVALSSGEA